MDRLPYNAAEVLASGARELVDPFFVCLAKKEEIKGYIPDMVECKSDDISPEKRDEDEVLLGEVEIEVKKGEEKEKEIPTESKVIPEVSSPEKTEVMPEPTAEIKKEGELVQQSPEKKEIVNQLPAETNSIGSVKKIEEVLLPEETKKEVVLPSISPENKEAIPQQIVPEKRPDTPAIIKSEPVIEAKKEEIQIVPQAVSGEIKQEILSELKKEETSKVAELLPENKKPETESAIPAVIPEKSVEKQEETEKTALVPEINAAPAPQEEKKIESVQISQPEEKKTAEALIIQPAEKKEIEAPISQPEEKKIKEETAIPQPEETKVIEAATISQPEEKPQNAEENNKSEQRFDIMETFFGFLKTKEVNPVLAGYFEKTIEGLFEKRKNDVLAYIFKFTEHIDNLVLHSYNKSIADVIQKILANESFFRQEDTVDEFAEQKEKILNLIIQKMKTSKTREDINNNCAILCHLIDTKQQIKYFLSDRVIGEIFAIAETMNPDSIVGAFTLLTTLNRLKAPPKPVPQTSMYSFSPQQRNE